MWKSGIAVAVLVLAGCTSTGSRSGFVDFIDPIQAEARAICHFVPAAETILALLGVRGSGSVTSIASAICEAVTSFEPEADADQPTIDGVTIRGFFVE